MLYDPHPPSPATRRLLAGRLRTVERVRKILDNLRAGRPCAHGFAFATPADRAAYTIAQQLLARRGLIRWTGTRWELHPEHARQAGG